MKLSYLDKIRKGEYNKFMKLIFLGTGTSHGVPVIKCNCKVCKSSDRKNKRFRSSVYIIDNSTNSSSVDSKKSTCILIDIGPDFRMQALNNNISQIDAVLLTHAHADHLFGLDDLRIFSCMMSCTPENPQNEKYNNPPIPIYTNQKSADILKQTFAYLFMPVKEGGGHAKIEVVPVKNDFNISNLKITPIPMMHGHMETTGWIINNVAYLTDCNFISDESFKLIKETCPMLEYLIIDGLRIKPHSTHFNFDQALEAANKISTKNVLLTHLTHNSSHEEVNEYIKEHLHLYENLNNIVKNGGIVEAAYDQLELDV